MDRLDGMRLFLAVAELGSFAAAARRLRLTPTAASRAVAALEDRLGVALLVRTTRSVRLTQAGEGFRLDCRRILTALAEAEQRAAGADATPRGVLAVAAPLLFGRLHVVPVVLDLLRRHPDLSVRLTLADRQVPLVESGIDVAVRIGDLPDSSMVAIRVGAVRQILVASPAYLRDRGAPAEADGLRRHDLIAFDGIEPVEAWHLGPAGTPVPIAPRLAVNTADAALAAAEAGLGITRLLSYQAAPGIAAGRLVQLLPALAGAERPVHVVHPARRLASAAVAAFVATARGRLRAALTQDGIRPGPSLPPG